MKQCPQCKETLSTSSFPKNRSRGDGLGSYCKVCKNKQSRYTSQEYHLRTTHNLSSKEYNRLIAEQEHQCANCKTSNPKGRHNRWHIDHDHITGNRRGLLCHSCNTGIGLLGDNLAGLQQAVHYLSKSEPTLFPGIWKRIAPKISSSISAPFGQETLSGCSDNKSLSEMGSASTVVQMTS